ncbi:MAG: isopentenyl-diphosphate Delta-isomerase [Chitinophagales bacterium]|nr:isopentenyl-diphosphate Delta-isomerase [Chitinophagales bacterium]OJV30081.1 MAG: isopentenyl-diphosphate delta-isomerase [Bacteroidetes bacterium 37-13]HRN95803.1 isopentenyl-diphosphate Delta-isomerase [Chitinophagales bacterium]HRP39106.1 isopentenyl-diphosphate Delta-isomerase [Chitinophagales bacterium]
MEDIQIEEQVVLVDENCRELGLMPKLEAHEKGVLHKAVSIIIFNEAGEMLITQRAFEKYHWPGIWSNACCTHPRENESFLAAAERRLQEELGFETPLKEVFRFVYKAQDEITGLVEHEYDTVFIGEYNNANFEFNRDEIADVEWVTKSKLLAEFENEPQKYSFWFKIILKELVQRNIF